MNEHPHDALPAFALGALDADEASQVLNHVVACPTCRDDVAAWDSIVALLPYTSAWHNPPAYVRRRVFALISATRTAQSAAPAPRPRRAAGSAQRWTTAMAICSLALALVFGLLFDDTRQRAGMLAAQLQQRDVLISQMRGQLDQQAQQYNVQLAQRDQMISQIGVQLDRERREAAFIAARTTVSQPLGGTQATGKMYMQPGNTHAVLVVQSLPQPAPGKIYQFWLATEHVQVPSSTFTVGTDGAALVSIDAPDPVNQYAQVMVTVEPKSGSRTPSHEIVLQAVLPT